jgi:hypothetical protein
MDDIFEEIHNEFINSEDFYCLLEEIKGYEDKIRTK